MKANKLTQVGAARMLGVDQSSISNWLHRKRLIGRVEALDIERRTKGLVTVDSWPTSKAEAKPKARGKAAG